MIVDLEKVRQFIDDFDLANSSRKREKVWFRSALFNFLKNYSKMSLQSIADLCHRDHATVLNALQIYRNNIRYSDFQNAIHDIELILMQCFKEDNEIVLSPLEEEVLNCKCIADFRALRNKIVQKVEYHNQQIQGK